VILGHRARRQIARSGGRIGGDGIVTGGLICGYAGMGLALFVGMSIVLGVRMTIGENERSAPALLREIHEEAAAYARHQGSYPPDLDAFVASRALFAGESSGYRFTYRARDTNNDGSMDRFTVHAEPVTPAWTGWRYFFIDETGIVHQASLSPAGPRSPPASFGQSP
jgi:hypothetical protein